MTSLDSRDIPSQKETRYDRQLRLWGDHGQANLERSRVCLINASALGTEILKNLILPGVGSFTIIDSHKIKNEDLGNNFFLDVDKICQARGPVTASLLSELNEGVNIEAIEENLEIILANNPHFFSSFNVVIATNLHERELLSLSNTLNTLSIPLVVGRCYGFIGYIRVDYSLHTVIESHPDNTHPDLRLDRSFDELKRFCESVDMASLDKKEHSHTPWLVLIYQYLQKWKDRFQKPFPQTYKEKCELKEMLKTGILTNEDGVPEDEENFDEAIRNINVALLPTKIPHSVKQIFENPLCLNLTQNSSKFWILSNALKHFVENEGAGALPLRGDIPDMTSDSDRYVKLQSIYRQRADYHVSLITKYTEQILEDLKRGSVHNELLAKSRSGSEKCCQIPDEISNSDIQLFCKNASFLQIINGRSLSEEFNPATANTSLIASRLEDPDDDTVHYIMLRSVDRFYNEYKRFPAVDADTLEADINKLKICVIKLLQDWSISATIKDEVIHEYCRYGAAELHSVAAYVSGAAAQEVIKLLTGQFIPINNTHIYNGIKQTSVTLEL